MSAVIGGHKPISGVAEPASDLRSRHCCYDCGSAVIITAIFTAASSSTRQQAPEAKSRSPIIEGGQREEQRPKADSIGKSAEVAGLADGDLTHLSTRESAVPNWPYHRV